MTTMNSSGNLAGFDATRVEPDVGFEPIPEGKYTCAIVASAFETTKDGTGQMLKLELQVIDGACKGRKVFSRLNLKNKSDEAVRIAQSQLSAICRAVGVLKPKDSSELHNIPMLVSIRIKRRDDNGDLVNEVKGFSAVGHAGAAPAPAPAPAGQQAAWARK
jgi:hypothetical protein